MCLCGPKGNKTPTLLLKAGEFSRVVTPFCRGGVRGNVGTLWRTVLFRGEFVGSELLHFLDSLTLFSMHRQSPCLCNHPCTPPPQHIWSPSLLKATQHWRSRSNTEAKLPVLYSQPVILCLQGLLQFHNFFLPFSLPIKRGY